MSWCVRLRLANITSSLKRFQKSIQLAGAITSTLLKHYVTDKLESILDKESKITHEMLSAQIEARLGSGEGDNAKPPDAKVWSKGKGLGDVRVSILPLSVLTVVCRSIGLSSNSVIPPSSYRDRVARATTYAIPRNRPRTTFHTKEFSSSRSGCDINRTAPMLGGLLSLTPLP